MEISDVHELLRQLRDMLGRVGGRYAANEALADVTAAFHYVRADEIEHDAPQGPFFDFTISLGAAVFAIYSDRIEIYVLPCDGLDERRLISAFQPIPMVDVTRCREVLAHEYDRAALDFIVSPDLTARLLGTGPTSKSR
jgi:hypothetical protein